MHRLHRRLQASARGALWASSLALAAASCSPAGAPDTAASSTAVTSPSSSSDRGGALSRPPAAAVGATPIDARSDGGTLARGDASSEAKARRDMPEAPPVLTADEAEAAQFLTRDARSAPEVVACRSRGSEEERIHCSLAALLEGDPLAIKTAVELHARTGHVVGVEVEQWMDGGYRGKLHLVPEPPILAQRKHLEWVAQAAYDFDVFFEGLAAAAGARPIRYRHRPLLLRYFRSVGARTPSAFAYDWTVSYNVAGSLHRTADAVRETMFHEIFHLNDRAHGDFSSSALGALYAGITARCGTRIPCLAPYAPSETVIRGGTYYAFHPQNGVGEYAAELALRYYREQRAVLLKRPLSSASFKCGPPENAKAWDLLRDEFFGGVDLVPPCRTR